MKLLDVVAAVICWRKGARVRQLRENLAAVVPPARLRSTTRAGIASYLRYWVHMVRLPADWSRRTEVVGAHELTQALARGSGAVVAAAHQGNWDWAATWAASRYGSVTTVAERVQPEWLYQWFVRRRARRGIAVLPYDARVIQRLQGTLRHGGLVALLTDRRMGGTGVEVDFLDRRIEMPPGAAVLAERTGAALFVATTRYTETGLTVELTEIAEGDVGSRLQQIAGILGASIQAHPHDWHMLQPVFTR